MRTSIHIRYFSGIAWCFATRHRPNPGRLFEAAQDGILILDAKTGAIMDVNPFLIKMLGYSRAEFVEKKLWEVGAFKDIEASQQAFEALQKNEHIRYEDLPLRAKTGGRSMWQARNPNRGFRYTLPEPSRGMGRVFIWTPGKIVRLTATSVATATPDLHMHRCEIDKFLLKFGYD